MAAFLGVELPDEQAVDGRNYLASWLGKEEAARDYVITQASNHTLSLRTRNWKYIEPKGGPAMVPWGPKIETGYSNSPQLYFMGDVGEKVNVAGLYPEVVDVLARLLQAEKNRMK